MFKKMSSDIVGLKFKALSRFVVVLLIASNPNAAMLT
jgi:hypothetical protein